MSSMPYTKESARKLWTAARDKYQNQLDSKKTQKFTFARNAQHDTGRQMVEISYTFLQRQNKRIELS